MAFKLMILTPDGKPFEGEVVSVTVPGAAGSLGVLTGHAPMVSALKPGVVTVECDGVPPSLFVIPGGLMVVKQQESVLLADVALPAGNGEDAAQKLQGLVSGNATPAPADK